jgi:hypothetical protein
MRLLAVTCRPMRSAALLAALSAAVVLAQEPDEPVHLGDTAKWGRVERIMKIDYPFDALKRRQSGSVEISGVVQANGLLDDITYTPDRPESAVFVSTLQGNVRHWLFTPPLGRDCLPVPTRVAAQVSFELDDGEPRIFVTHAKKDASPAVVRKPHYNPVSRKKLIYPFDMVKRNWIATVYARIQVEADGNVSDVRARPFSRPSRHEDDLVAFTHTVVTTLKEWKFPPVPEGEKAPWFGCYTIQFNLTS